MDGNLFMGYDRVYGKEKDCELEHDYSLHVHNDIEDAAKWYKIPLVIAYHAEVYIMQEDRCVFIGKIKNAEDFLRRNEGKYCKSIFPLQGKQF